MTPVTATGRKVIAIYGDALLDDVIGIEAEATMSLGLAERARAVIELLLSGEPLNPDDHAHVDAVLDLLSTPIHFNDGAAEERAMAWSAGYSDGFSDGVSRR